MAGILFLLSWWNVISDILYDGRYKTRAHKAEGRLQEEAGKQKSLPTAPDTGDTSTAGQGTEQAMQAKVRLSSHDSDMQLFQTVVVMVYCVSGEGFAGGKEGIGGKVGSTFP